MKLVLDNFDLAQIDKSGQCFRWKELDSLDEQVTYCIPAFGKLLKIVQKGNEFDFSCSKKEWDNIWKSYFDIDRDYSLIEKKIFKGKDEHLKNAFKYGSGIRILKQDTWEMIFSFMISQNNNIPRIRKSIEMISSRCGKKLDEDIYAFPEVYEIPLSIFDDTSLGLGYRAPYLRELCEFVLTHPDWISSLEKMGYDAAYASLIERKGIGCKVANCICLFGLGHVESFPIDTHVKKLLAKHYPDGIDLSSFEGEAGIIQQYLFYYDLNEK